VCILASADWEREKERDGKGGNEWGEMDGGGMENREQE
jgi:hypothetical protein